MWPSPRAALEAVRRRYWSARRRLRRVERRELRDLRAWLEDTRNLLHVSVLVCVPLLIGLVTWLSNSFTLVSFLLFPPLASGTYTLFADPKGRYSTPGRFVAGMTAGAVCGWVALVAARVLYATPAGVFEAHAGAAALGVFMTGVATWALDIEEPSAFSTALLVLLVGQARLAYVVGVAVSSALVAGVFVLWRDRVYGRRSDLLYRSTSGDDRVLVPLRTGTSDRTVTFAARLAAAHEAGKVVLLELVAEAELAAARRALEGENDENDETAAAQVAAQSALSAERLAARTRTSVGVPCEVAVAAGDADDHRVVLDTAAETSCDLVVAPYEAENGSLVPYLRRLLAARKDVVVFHSVTDRTSWNRVLVAVRRAGDSAHAMVDFAERVAGESGTVSVCTCIGSARERRSAELTLERLVETVGVAVETRVARQDVESFLADNAAGYDLVVVGSSTDRSAASRFVSRPTFERLHDLDSDIAIVHYD